MTPLAFPRGQMVREATLTEADLVEVDKCRRDHNRLAFAYQIGFVRLFSRFPAQQPLEICDELLHFVSLQVGIEEARIADYAPWQHTTSEHQGRIRDYLKLVVFDTEQAEALERFVFEESCRLEQTASLLARVREFLARWGPPVRSDAGDALPPDFASQCEALLDIRPAVASSIMGLFPRHVEIGRAHV